VAEYTVARIHRARGNRGEVLAEIFRGGIERFPPGSEWTLNVGGATRSVTVEDAWVHQGRAVLKFAGVDSIGDAEALAGGEIRAEPGPLDEGEYLVADLIGCELYDRGERVGVVTEFQETGGTPLLVVETTGGELLVPFVKAICREIRTADRRIEAELPEGLRDLNQ
jgi:16S rRNA processing protein RimM